VVSTWTSGCRIRASAGSGRDGNHSPVVAPALIGLALVGVLALLRLAARSVVRFLLRAAEETAATGRLEIGVRRGDLTAMNEAREARRSARRARRRDGAAAALWLLWLAAPLLTPWAREGYALAASLWLLPGARRPLRRRGAREPAGR
jgi:hypothetical protein